MASTPLPQTRYAVVHLAVGHGPGKRNHKVA